MSKKAISQWDEDDIKRWISKNKVLFFTNSRCLPGSMFLSSMRTYIDYIPVHNFQIIYGEKEGRPFYGLDVFMSMTSSIIRNDFFIKNFDYGVYIDEDCFVVDFNALMEDIVDFVENGSYCMAGPQDGGMICHRNHSRLLFNSYVSFWNFKTFRTAVDAKYYIDTVKQIYADKNKSHLKFMELMKNRQPELLIKMNAASKEMIEKGKKFREEHFPINSHGRNESPYAETVRNDHTNPIEPNQIPYSYKDDEGMNFEPYYLIEEAWVLATGCPIKYLFHTDLFLEEETDSQKTDNSGLTSALYCAGKLAVVHTWFSRMYTKWPIDPVMSMHTARINKIIIKYGEL